MAFEHQLKMIVDGFANTSRDFVKWAEFLDVRAHFVAQAMHVPPQSFGPGARHVAPPPRNVTLYRETHVSLQDAATRLADIADCQTGMLNSVSPALKLNPALVPANPDFAENILGKLDESQLLHLILGWQQQDIGIFKAFMRVYGLVPIDPPLAPHPGPGRADRLCEVIVSWLKVIQTDANHFVTIQHFNKPVPTIVPAAANDHDALANFEKQYHRLVDNYLVLMTVLPYHLFVANP